MTRMRMLAAVGAIAAVSVVAAPLLAARGSREQVPTQSDLALIGGVMQLVSRDYVHPLNGNELTDDALKGMLTRLDPHSDYMNEQEYQQSQADMEGKFGGIGVQISDESGVPRVIAPIDGTPAAQAGLEPGDFIVDVDGQPTRGIGPGRIVDILRGKPGSNVKLTISRSGKPPFDVSLTRSIIRVDTVKAQLQDNRIGYIRISEFGARTPKEFTDAVENLRKQSGGELKGVVLDLRNDPGGLLGSAVDVASSFLDGGTVVTIHGRRASEDHVFKTTGRRMVPSTTPVVVLINSASASASEIVAGALQDRHRATILGTRSFGKGSVQSIIPIPGHGALRLTTALYYTPSGRSIQGRGIAPDVVVDAPKDEQVANAALMHESDLYGAFKDIPPLSQNRDNGRGDDESRAPGGTASVPASDSPEYSPPIKPQIIGTPQDAQLKAAMDYLQKNMTTAEKG